MNFNCGQRLDAFMIPEDVLSKFDFVIYVVEILRGFHHWAFVPKFFSYGLNYFSCSPSVNVFTDCSLLQGTATHYHPGRGL